MLEWKKVGTDDYRLSLNGQSYVLNLTRDVDGPANTWTVKSGLGLKKIGVLNLEYAQAMALTIYASQLALLATEVTQMYMSTDLYKRTFSVELNSGNNDESKSTG